MRLPPRRIAIPAVLLLCGVALNVLAYRHARSFTRFSEDGVRTARPEQLSALQRLVVLFSGPTLPKPRNESTPADRDLPYRRLAFPGADGHRLEAWRITGRRGLALMFHGYADSKDSLLDHAAAFAELGFGVAPVDFRGSGGSSGFDTSIGFHEARDVKSAVAALAPRSGDGPVVLHGVSMGAVAVLRAVAVERVQADALILEAPFDRLLRTIEHRFEALGAPPFPAARLLLFWGGLLQGFDAFEHNPVEYAARVQTPTLLMHGADDARVSLPEARAIFEALAGPKSFRVFAGVGHESLERGAPAEWQRAVSEFLEPLAPAARQLGAKPALTSAR